VVQRLPAGGYSYLALRVEARESAREQNTDRGALLRAVTLGKGAPAGARVRVRSMGHRRHFYSRRLNRTFPDLVFGIVSRLD